MNSIIGYISEFIQANYVTDIRVIDMLEILIIAICLYRLMVWIQNTKAWMLLRGILVIGVFILFAIIFNMQTILFIAKNSVNILATAVIVVFQPEIRRALENLGQKNIIYSLSFFEKKKDKKRISDKVVNDIIESCIIMSREKTGALIVLENEVKLTEYIATGIQMDCKISSQILLNIFEHNTPLHDGAVILNGSRIAAATCYLPLTENDTLSKRLGTRHRAAIGISEASDALVIIVSEETGKLSIAKNAAILTDVSEEQLKASLQEYALVKNVAEVKSLKKVKGGHEDEKNTLS